MTGVISAQSRIIITSGVFHQHWQPMPMDAAYETHRGWEKGETGWARISVNSQFSLGLPLSHIFKKKDLTGPDLPSSLGTIDFYHHPSFQTTLP
jgi:hypothetical protein